MRTTNVYWVIFCTASFASPEPQEQSEAASASYDGSQVWRTSLRTHADVNIFNRFSANQDISLWSVDARRVDYLVHDKDRMRIHRELEAHNLNHTVLIMDVQRRIDATKISTTVPWTNTSLRIGHRLSFKHYPTLNVIDEFFTHLEENYNSISNIHNIGYSVENRTIKMITISNGDPNNKKIFIMAGQHAREWVSVTSALYIANNIVTKYDKQPSYMKNKDWYIIPLLNPDGYMHTQTKDRLWRKNRRDNRNSKCPGVDLNRNYPKHWHVAGLTQNNMCQEDFSGPFPLSEPETLAVFNVLDSIGDKMPSAFFDLHSYGQLILYPWAIKGKTTEHRDYLDTTAKTISQAIYNATGHKYTYGSPGAKLYSVSGAAIDWFHSKGVTLCYAIEGRDTGSHGFLLPPDNIEGAGKELLGAVRSVAKILEPSVRMRSGAGSQRWF